MKRISAILVMCAALTLAPVVSVNAQSLDELINEQPTTEYSSETDGTQDESDNGGTQDTPEKDEDYNGEYIDEMKDATDLSAPSKGVTKFNEGVKKVASFIVQALCYAATACLVIRVLLDIIYIVLPFTRAFLSNGYAGNPQSQGMQQGGMNGMGGMGSMGMGGMGGYGMGGYGMGGYGSSRYGMGGMGSMGMGGMNAMQQGMSQPGATPAMGRIQWVSTAALNAAAAETVTGPNGKTISALRAYAKDMFIVLILAPVFLVLAVTGTLTNLGLFLGEVIAKAISSIGGML